VKRTYFILLTLVFALNFSFSQRNSKSVSGIYKTASGGVGINVTTPDHELKSASESTGIAQYNSRKNILDIFVSPKGNDSNTGEITSPFRTISKTARLFLKNREIGTLTKRIKQYGIWRKEAKIQIIWRLLFRK